MKSLMDYGVSEMSSRTRFLCKSLCITSKYFLKEEI